MPRHARSGALAAAALAVLTTSALVAGPASAAPWDGGGIAYGPGYWSFNSSSFTVEDVNLLFPDDDRDEYTDIWDGAGLTSVWSEALGLEGEDIACADFDDIDVVIEDGSGDLVLTCAVDSTAFAEAGLSVVSEIRVLAGGEIVRFLTTITNTRDADATIDSVYVYTDFGSTGDLYDYANQSDSVLAVPAPEGDDLTGPLNEVDAHWIVHAEEYDAPGGLVIGSAGSAASSEWSYVDGDSYEAQINAFVIPAGQSRSVVTFATWDPQTLIDGDYSNNGETPELLAASASAVVAGMARFASLSGVLAVGIDDLSSVVNWSAAAVEPAPAPAPAPAPVLPDTGAGEASLLALGGVVLLALGAVLAGRRRARA